MTKRRKKKKINNINKFLLIILLFLIYVFYVEVLHGTYALPVLDNIYPTTSTNETVEKETNIKEELKVYFIDVGQADSILINSNNEYMLIDAGNNNDGKLLVEYFKSLNITTFKYIVGTHPHEDHIGGIDDIINNFNIENILLPDAITTTKTFTDVLDAIENKNLNITIPTTGEKINLGKSKLEVIYTGKDESDLNNTSIVLKLQYYNNTFLFTGDATSKTEKLILNKNIEADVLKIGHHGSRYSSTKEFINKVNPKYAVISVGTNNTYKHPADTTLNKLKMKNIEVYRTDELGTIITTCDGNNYKFTNIKTNTNGG